MKRKAKGKAKGNKNKKLKARKVFSIKVARAKRDAKKKDKPRLKRGLPELLSPAPGTVEATTQKSDIPTPPSEESPQQAASNADDGDAAGGVNGSTAQPTTGEAPATH